MALSCVVAILALLVINALVQATPPLQARKTGTLSTTKPLHTPIGQGQPAQSFSDWVPQQLPDGWMNAGLMMGDDLQAVRTATTFNDREMSLDYRSVGTRNNHSGTFLAATFLLTFAARERFMQNDARVINNTLFDLVVSTQLVRAAINPQPRVVKFAVQGQQQFAWADVSFQLWQSHLDPNDPQHQRRIEGKDMDPTTNQPRIHHMVVLLLRVPPEAAGANPAMGGTGWLVSNYALDQAGGALPGIIQPA